MEGARDLHTTDSRRFLVGGGGNLDDEKRVFLQEGRECLLPNLAFASTEKKEERKVRERESPPSLGKTLERPGRFLGTSKWRRILYNQEEGKPEKTSIRSEGDDRTNAHRGEKKRARSDHGEGFGKKPYPPQRDERKEPPLGGKGKILTGEYAAKPDPTRETYSFIYKRKCHRRGRVFSCRGSSRLRRRRDGRCSIATRREVRRER